MITVNKNKLNNCTRNNFVSNRTLFYSILLFGVAFTIGYGCLGYLPHWNSIEFSTAVDSAIPYIPEFAIFYIAGMFYAFLAFFVVRDLFRFKRMLKGFFIIMGVAYICFLLFPVFLPKNVVYGDTIFDLMVKNWHINDTNFNNFPSLHVAFSVYAWLIVFTENRKLAYWTLPIVVGIVASVLLIKSHLVIDVIGGLVLSVAVFFWYKIKS